jgi:hypothetical protein
MKKFYKVFAVFAAVFAATTIVQAQVAITTDGSAPHTSAMLEVKSTNKGLLIPRLTTVQRTTLGGTATAGLMVYDTDLGRLFFHDGIGWNEGGIGNYWTRSSGDLYPSTLTDNLGIGTNNPVRPLEVFSSNWQVARISTSLSGPSLELVGSAGTDWALTSWVNELQLESSGDNFASRTTQYRFANSYFIPNTTDTRSLGHSSYRWSGLFSVDGDFSGLVGIGTSAPSSPLHVTSGQSGGSSSVALVENTYTGVNGWVYAFQGRVNSTSPNTSPGIGVLGLSTSSAGGGVGVFGQSNGVSGFGVKAVANASTGENFGLYAGTNSPSGYAGYFYGGKSFFQGSVGIGTLNPLGKLHVHDGSSSNAIVYITPMSTGSEDNSTLFMAEDDDATYGMYWFYDGVGNQMELYGKSIASTYGPHLVVDRNDGDVSIGGVFASGYKLSVDGKIICEELRVNMSEDWPDYVFRKGYPLLPIEKLGVFIEENGHLPNIPSADEISESGLEVGEMQRLMMEKIEELSLYIVEQQKKNMEQQQQIGELKAMIEELKNK